MEQPQIFTPEAYEKVACSMQPVYGQTKGLGNKAIIKAVAQALGRRTLEREYLPEKIRRKYELAEYNYAIEHIHFPMSREELMAARKRLVFDEFLFFLLAVRRLKERRQDVKSLYPMEPAREVEELCKRLPYQLTAAQKKVLKRGGEGSGKRLGDEPADSGRRRVRKDHRCPAGSFAGSMSRIPGSINGANGGSGKTALLSRFRSFF